MAVNFKKLFILIGLFGGLSLTTQAFAQEESFSLDEVQEVVAPKPAHATSKFSIMGRVDLTFDKTIDDRSDMRNNHFLLFLKANASKKVSFLGEFVNQSFYHVDYEANPNFAFSFGKIMVPFGDPRRYHSYYGGVQGYGINGVMFPNIWAEPGVNFKLKLGSSKFDAYMVNGINASSKTTDIDLQSSTTERQAVGLRWSQVLVSRLNTVVSAYYSDYWPGQPLYLGGFDVYSDYGYGGLDHLRFSYGVAKAWVQDSPTGRDFYKLGDFYEFATNVFNPMEWRLRYGSYDDDDRTDTVDDTQSLNLAASFPLDVLKILIEYQWNFEEVNETDNDLARAMVSLDF